MKSTIGLALILIILLLAQVSNATTQYTGVVSQSMGGAGRAGVQATEVGLLNPASFAFISGYTLDTQYRDFQTVDNGTTRNVLIHASENDTGSAFPLAITYFKTRDMNSSAYGVREDYHLTTAQTFAEKYAFGIDVARYTYTPEGVAEDTEWDLKLGFMFVPREDWGFGLVLTNLLVTDFSFLKRGLELGVNYLFKDFFRMAFDVTYQLEDNLNKDGVVMLGIEHMYIKQIPLRLGFKWDDPENANYVTFGLGWNAPRIGFGYTFEKNVAETKEYGHSFDLKIYF